MTNAIAVFDIGKTNKKLLLFDEQYKIILERSSQFDEIKDEDGFPCEDVSALAAWLERMLDEILSIKDISAKAINFSAYGASFVHIGKDGNPVAPLYNYLKPFPEKLQQQFYSKYGGEIHFSQTTASPVLGNLNSGLQLYRLKFEQEAVFKHIYRSLHLPQYISSILTKKYFSDITSIGCHTALWDFQKRKYHDWVYAENIIEKLAEIIPGDEAQQIQYKEHDLKIGPGMHDSSAALVPYLLNFTGPFILLSTGTWNISLNPFNEETLTTEELQQDCLCYLTHEAKPVKASRLFAGHEYDLQVKRIVSHFHQQPEKYASLDFNNDLLKNLEKEEESEYHLKTFSQRDLKTFSNDETAYYRLVADLVLAQQQATRLIMNDDVKQLFVDGGFSKNAIFMNFLAAVFPKQKIYAASVAQASALGAAMAIHKSWNEKNIPENVIQLKYYPL